ncbi:hypothetical protein B0H14DRAFT_528762 [Mycena olivaceomarginata]|nr:hypothetical protein B0H14DRAFT_528762 [Mycena olivaceomarginata]
MSTFKAPDPAIATTTAPTALDPPAWFNTAMDEKLEQFNAAMDEKLERFKAAIDEKLKRFTNERLKPITTDLQEMRQHVAMIHMLAANVRGSFSSPSCLALFRTLIFRRTRRTTSIEATACFPVLAWCPSRFWTGSSPCMQPIQPSILCSGASWTSSDLQMTSFWPTAKDTSKGLYRATGASGNSCWRGKLGARHPDYSSFSCIFV